LGGVRRPFHLVNRDSNGLTKRQRDYAALISADLTNLEIARVLFVSVETVKNRNQIRVIRRALDARSRTGIAVQYALATPAEERQGLVESLFEQARLTALEQAAIRPFLAEETIRSVPGKEPEPVWSDPFYMWPPDGD
jgi:DNA-binding CsgD family transcriptional regulator